VLAAIHGELVALKDIVRGHPRFLEVAVMGLSVTVAVLFALLRNQGADGIRWAIQFAALANLLLFGVRHLVGPQVGRFWQVAILHVLTIPLFVLFR